MNARATLRRGRVGPALGNVLLLLLLLPSWASAQVLDPQSCDVEIVCPNPLLVTPAANGDPLGDIGLMVTCRDADGDPVAGIPGSAFHLEAGNPGLSTFQEGSGPPLADAETDEFGQILLVNRIGAGGYVLEGGVVVRYDPGGGGVLLNFGPPNDLQVRSPDFNGDLIVNLTDVLFFAQCFYGSQCPEADLDGDGEVGLSDVVIMQRSLGESSPKDVSLSATVLDRLSRAQKAGEDLFAGCLQRDFDEDDGPSVLRTTITVAPFTPFSLKILARDFRAIAGVEFDISLPSDVRLAFSDCFTAEGPFVPAPGLSVPCGATSVPTIQVVVDGVPCVTDEPVFVAELQLVSDVPQELDISQFAISGKLSDCHFRPNEFTACIGSPTPCQASYLELDPAPFLSCPGGDLDTSETLTLVLRDQNGNGVSGVAASEVTWTLEEIGGGLLGDTFELLPQATQTDSEGRLPFLFQPRETCMWDRCLDLLITFEYEGCELTVEKSVRSVNAVRYEDSPTGTGFDVVNLEDVAAFSLALYTADPCLDLYQNYRCPLVTLASADLVGAHFGHECSVVGVEPPAPFSGVQMSQNAPNPFNPLTVFEVRSSRTIASARLEVYTLAGRHVRQLWAGTFDTTSRVFRWDGHDDHGLAAASGVYVARFTGDGVDASIRMVLLR